MIWQSNIFKVLTMLRSNEINYETLAYDVPVSFYTGHEPNFSHISCAHISKSKSCFNMKSSTYDFHVKTKIMANFQIYISVPLKSLSYAFFLSPF